MPETAILGDISAELADGGADAIGIVILGGTVVTVTSPR